MPAPRIRIAIDWRYGVAFYCVVMLWSSLHELAHHVAGFAVCGAWGTKTFNYFSTACEASPTTWLATFAGPLFSFAAMWFGWWLLARLRSTPLQRQIGFATIFAQMPLQRMSGPLMGHNDEYFAAWHLWGKGPVTAALTLAVICAFCIPPMVGAWRAIGNPRRLAWFAFYAALFPYLLWGPPFILLEYLLVQRHVMNGQWIGIAHLFILNEIVTIAAYVATRHWLLRRTLTDPTVPAHIPLHSLEITS